MADSSSSSGRHQRHRQQQQHHQQQQQMPQQQQQQQYYDERGVEGSQLTRVPSGNGSNSGRGSDKKQQRHHADNRSQIAYSNVVPPSLAPTTGQFRSGHIEVDSLYGQASSNLVVNAMNAPNNSTMQCGCENIDCPFCNLMTSVQMKESPY